MQNDKFAVSLQYLKKKVSNEVDFVRADKDENLLQIDRMTLMGMVKHSQSSQNSKFALSLQYRKKKKVIVEVDFLHADNHHSFLQVDFNICSSKFPSRWYYHYWWAWSSILKGLKVTVLQYVYNMSKKKLRTEFIFCM